MGTDGRRAACASALLGDLFGQAPAKGTLQTAVETCADGLAGVEEQI